LRLPDLNARSELIKQATDRARIFLKDFLGPECILFAAGGSILAIAPTTMVKKALEGARYRLGYKLHLAVDASSDLPLAVIAAPANENEKKHAQSL
jgi:IS5 family transposase